MIFVVFILYFVVFIFLSGVLSFSKWHTDVLLELAYLKLLILKSLIINLWITLWFEFVCLISFYFTEGTIWQSYVLKVVLSHKPTNQPSPELRHSKVFRWSHRRWRWQAAIVVRPGQQCGPPAGAHTAGTCAPCGYGNPRTTPSMYKQNSTKICNPNKHIQWPLCGWTNMG